jgi:16S rRNA (guanine966-N2)-methyltransferase
MELLAPELKGARVLELFAGTGAVGLEALSRGARWVDFVEHGPSSLHALKANIAALRVGKQARLFKVDAIPFVERLGGPVVPPPPDPDAEFEAPPQSPFPYDICFMDPPYGSRAAGRVVRHWMENNFSRVLTLETAADSEHELPGKPMRRVFGDTAISVYRSRWMPPRHIPEVQSGGS